MDAIADNKRYADLIWEQWSYFVRRHDGDAWRTEMRSFWCRVLKHDRYALGILTKAMIHHEVVDWRAWENKEHIRTLLPHNPVPQPEWAQRPREEYRAAVDAITNKQPLSKMPGIELRGDGWELDHFVSVSEGHKQNIPPEKIGHISNLRMVPRTQNRMKHGRNMYQALAGDGDSIHQ
jgi:hypothetical protein